MDFQRISASKTFFCSNPSQLKGKSEMKTGQFIKLATRLGGSCAFALFCTNSNSQVVGSITTLEASYVPLFVYFQLNQPVANCPAGTWLIWEGGATLPVGGSDETGRRMNDRVEITAGLKGAETVVVNGAAFLAQGDTVRVVADGK